MHGLPDQIARSAIDGGQANTNAIVMWCWNVRRNGAVRAFASPAGQVAFALVVKKPKKQAITKMKKGNTKYSIICNNTRQ